MHSDNTTMISRILKYFRVVFLAVVSLIGLLFILVQLPWVKTAIVETVLTAATSSLRGTVSVGGVEGTLFTSIRLRHVVVSLDRDNVVTAERIEADYTPWDLLSGRITVGSLIADSIDVRAFQDSAGTWNVLSAFSSRIVQEDTAGDDQPFGWGISVDSIHLFVTRALLHSAGGEVEDLPAVEDLLVQGRLRLEGERLGADVHHLAFRTRNPDVTVVRCRLGIDIDTTEVRVDSFSLITAKNEINGNGRISRSSGSIHARMQSAPLDFSEFERLTGVHITARPVLGCTVSYDGRTLNADIGVGQGRSKTNIKGWYRMDTSPAEYAAEITLSNTILDDWLGKPAGVRLSDGFLKVEGKGVRRGETEAHVTLRLAGLRFGATRVDRLSGSVMLSSDDAEVSMLVSSGMGEMTLAGSIEDLFGERRFQMKGVCSGVTLSRFSELAGSGGMSFTCNGTAPDGAAASLSFETEGNLADLDLKNVAGVSSDIPLSFAANGTFTVPDQIDVRAFFHSDSLLVDHVRFERFTASVRLSERVLVIDSVAIAHNGCALHGQGVFDPEDSSAIILKATIPDASLLTELSGVDLLEGSGELQARLNGPLRTPSVEVALRLEDARWNSLRIGDLAAEVSAELQIDSVISCVVPQARFLWNDSSWTNDDTLILRSDNEGIYLRGLRLLSGGQAIVAEGELLHQAARLHVQTEQVALGPVAALLDSSSIDGILDLQFDAAGALSNPAIRSSIRVSGFGVGAQAGGEVEIEAALADSILRWNLSFLGKHGLAVHSDGFLPLRLTPDSAGTVLDRERPMDVSVKTDTFDLEKVGILSSGKWVVGGVAGLWVRLSGLPDSLRSEGEFHVNGGEFSYPAAGIAYRDIRIRGGLADEQVIIDDLYVGGGKGSINGTGSVPFHYHNGEWMLDPEVRLTANSFDVLNSPNYSATISGTVDVGYDQNTVSFDGEMKVDRSRLYIPALMKQGVSEGQKDPMLVTALQANDTTTVDSVVVDSAAVRRTGEGIPGLTGRLRIEIPKATWLRGPRTNVELSGRLDIALDSASIRLGGYLVVEQGTYDFYGKRFVVRKGRMDFDGSDKINPALVIDVEYAFRTESEENEMQIQIRGTATQPVLEFYVNRVRVSEADAISYLIFGRKSDELDAGARSTVTDMADVIAKDFAATMINTQLSSMAGKTLGLDVIRVSGEDDWSKTTLTAGKYIGNDLYVAYERGMSNSGSGNAIFQKTMLEYYLTKLFKVRLVESTDKSSGADIFMRFE